MSKIINSRKIGILFTFKIKSEKVYSTGLGRNFKSIIADGLFVLGQTFHMERYGLRFRPKTQNFSLLAFSDQTHIPTKKKRPNTLS